MKKIFALLLTLFVSVFSLSAQSDEDKRYLAGAVPLVNGYVQFDKSYNVKGKTKAEIMENLRQYIQGELVEGADQLPQSRITEITPDSGIIAASIEEYMYFRRTKWQVHRVRFYYQLVIKATDEHFDITMRRLHYSYDPEASADGIVEDRRAEKWITDEEALSKNGTKLTRIAGRFRTHTIDRKDEIFRSAAVMAGVQFKKKVKVIEVEEEE